MKSSNALTHIFNEFPVQDTRSVAHGHPAASRSVLRRAEWTITPAVWNRVLHDEFVVY
jgi:hypothetical protein